MPPRNRPTTTCRSTRRTPAPSTPAPYTRRTQNQGLSDPDSLSSRVVAGPSLPERLSALRLTASEIVFAVDRIESLVRVVAQLDSDRPAVAPLELGRAS